MVQTLILVILILVILILVWFLYCVPNSKQVNKNDNPVGTNADGTPDYGGTVDSEATLKNILYAGFTVCAVGLIAGGWDNFVDYQEKKKELSKTI